jgi:hypothetical protein
MIDEFHGSEMAFLAIGAWSGPLGSLIWLQSRRKLDLWQGCHEVAEKSSKIVPLGAPIRFNPKE